MSGRLPTHRPPATCPVCSDSLITLRLGCPSCGTELSGHFDTCRYCRLDAADLVILEVFLRSRGNLRDVQAHLGVSYPTARARLGDVLDRLGLGAPLPAAPAAPAPDVPVPPAPPQAPFRLAPPIPPHPPHSAAAPGGTASVMADLAAGRISVDEAERRLRDHPTP
jgi:hypothetical protein